MGFEEEEVMKQFITEQSFRSIHTAYLRFAILSLRACDQSRHELRTTYINRNAIEAIRYSYDCLEASAEFIFLLGQQKQLPIEISENWLSRSLHRKWANLSLSDKFGMLAFAWTGQAFWQHDAQYQLFTDLKKVRDGLTHPVPFGTEIEFEILSDEETAKDQVYGVQKPTGKFKYTKPDWLTNTKNAVATFAQSTDELEKRDAEQAVEIMLRHAIRIEDIFFTRRTTWFAFYELSEDQIYTTEELL